MVPPGSTVIWPDATVVSRMSPATRTACGMMSTEGVSAPLALMSKVSAAVMLVVSVPPSTRRGMSSASSVAASSATVPGGATSPRPVTTIGSVLSTSMVAP